MSIGRLQSDPGSPAKRKLEVFLRRGGGAAYGLTVDDAWEESNGIIAHTKVRQRVLGITVDQPPAAIGVTVEQRTKYNYDSRRDTLHIEASDWQVDSNAAAQCAADMCALMQNELRSELPAGEGCHESGDASPTAEVEAEISEAMRNWSGDPYASLLAGHVDKKSILAFVSNLRQICETHMLDWLKTHYEREGIE